MKDNILLSEVFYASLKDLPRWINSDRAIYQFRNLLNNKSYIGQAKSLYSRLVTGGKLSHKYCYEHTFESNSVIYLALHKYGLDKFELILLESNSVDLNASEKYWISELHTFIHDPLGPGYNMTKGGEDCSQLNTPEVIKKREEIRKQLYQEYISDPKNLEADLKFMREVLNSPEMIKKRALKNRHNREEYMKDPENAERERLECLRIAAEQRARHGGYLPFHTPEVYERLKAERGGDFMAYCHTKEARHKSDLTYLFNYLSELLGNIKQKGLAINAFNYCKPDGPFSKWSYKPKIIKYLNRIDELRKDSRWTDELEIIFSGFKLIDGKFYALNDSNEFVEIK